MDRFDIAAQFICDDDTGPAKSDDKLFQKPLSRSDVSPWLPQNIENVSVGVHGAPQPDIHAAVWHNDVVQMPFVCHFARDFLSEASECAGGRKILWQSHILRTFPLELACALLSVPSS